MSNATPEELLQRALDLRCSDIERKLAASILVAQLRAAADETMARQAAASDPSATMAEVIQFPKTTPTPTPSTTTAVAARGGSTMQFKKATKTKAKLRLTLDGPAGSGKTYSALELAKALGGKTALIDTERGSASKYADRFSFDTLELDEHSIETYLKAIAAAAAHGYEVLVIDSLSHAWAGKGGALERVDRSAAVNKFTAWRDVTPLHNRLVDAILGFPGHVICTMRTKTEWALEEDAKGKKVPKRIGTAPVQRDGMEYEFDVIADLSLDGNLTISKTRCPDLSGSASFARREDIGSIGAKLKVWLSDGSEAQPAPAPAPAPTFTPAANADQPRPAAPTEPSQASQPAPAAQMLEFIASARSQRELDALVPRIRKLSRGEQAAVRPVFMARKKELSHAGSSAISQ
jgi:DNA polymerase III delta prime subunit